MLLSDRNLEFTKAIGAELDLSDKPVGLGVRSRRYSMLVDDSVVKGLLPLVAPRIFSRCSEFRRGNSARKVFDEMLE